MWGNLQCKKSIFEKKITELVLETFPKVKGVFTMTNIRLSSEEEIELAKHIENGDITARDELIMANLRLVDSVARQYENPVVPKDDLIQEGRIGLIKAVDGFDYRKGCKFSTYATPLIRKAILDALYRSSGFTKLPDHLRKIGKVNSSYALLCQELQREPKPVEIARELGMTTKEVEDILLFGEGFISMDSPIKEGQTESTFGETLEDRSVDSEKQLSNQELIAKLQCEETPISDREKEVIRLKFFEELKSIEIAEQMGISPARVTQLSKTALEKLRVHFSL